MRSVARERTDSAVWDVARPVRPSRVAGIDMAGFRDRGMGGDGWSRKRLWSRFRSQIGLPSKRAVKLVRFDHAAHRLAAGERAVGVAAETGYADQSHLRRNVLAFTETTPAAIAGEPWLAVDDLAWRRP
ncbi:helix-turn-helix domain-containing protein [Streptosporangium saharense]|uniref:helix-turn-helix domain-containing protein n=1 Tax=Streptosporangium saharense TaxID=1706840 RepID=UPI0036C978D1